ncbi:hypothetical protein J2Z37_002236 [Ammoniphilus resinae]|uniref:Uncharacterized protein n=1 Tax=Ammoniphilus resinae TaxID=861532 RepID=A0ABS4GPP4_9BACL|nr:hypothetical protein [Ammoniphilus resinae]
MLAKLRWSLNFIGVMKIKVGDVMLVIELHRGYEDQCWRSCVGH